MAKTALTVVKIGGSLLGSIQLAACLEAIAASKAPVVIVPGGGLFADAMREAQRALDVPDAEAHCMALLAMAQFAHAICGRHERFCVAHSAGAASEMLGQNAIPVWSPVELTINRNQVPENWDMTSDSLAAWFAAQIGAGRLLLVKSAPHDPSLRPVDACTERGIVDPLFAQTVAGRGFDTYWIGDGDARRLSSFFDGALSSAVAIAA